ncbi:MAG: hypothetical protein U1F87_11580 [Kiritimatiellia bacterium]
MLVHISTYADMQPRQQQTPQKTWAAESTNTVSDQADQHIHGHRVRCREYPYAGIFGQARWRLTNGQNLVPGHPKDRAESHLVTGGGEA